MLKSDDILQSEKLRKTPLTVPEGYFDTLGERVMQRVAASGKQNVRSVPLRKWWIAAAAACTIAVMALAIRLSLPQEPAQTFYDNDAEYLELMDVSTRYLAEYGQETETDDISQEAIIEYLAYNGISGAYLYEQLAEAE